MIRLESIEKTMACVKPMQGRNSCKQSFPRDAICLVGAIVVLVSQAARDSRCERGSGCRKSRTAI